MVTVMTILTSRLLGQLEDKYIPYGPPSCRSKDNELNIEDDDSNILTYEGAEEILKIFQPWMGEFVDDTRVIYDCETTFDEVVGRWPEARDAFLHELKGDIGSATRYRSWDVPDGDAIAWYDALVEREGKSPPNRSDVFSTMLDVYFTNRYFRPQHVGVLFPFMANDYRAKLGKKVRPITWWRFNREKAFAAEGKFWKEDMMEWFDELPRFPIPQVVPVEAGPDKGKFRTPIEYWQNDERKFATSPDQLLVFMRDWWQETAMYARPGKFADENDHGPWMEMAMRAFDELFAEGKPIHEMLRDYFEAADGRLQDDGIFPRDMVRTRGSKLTGPFRETFQETVVAFYEWHVRRGRERPVLLLREIPSEESGVDFYDIHDKVEVRYPPNATFFK